MIKLMIACQMLRYRPMLSEYDNITWLLSSEDSNGLSMTRWRYMTESVSFHCLDIHLEYPRHLTIQYLIKLKHKSSPMVNMQNLTSTENDLKYIVKKRANLQYKQTNKHLKSTPVFIKLTVCQARQNEMSFTEILCNSNLLTWRRGSFHIYL